MTTNDELLDRAIRKYFREKGNNAEQPDRSLSQIWSGNYGLYVDLRNINGNLARYRVIGEKRMKQIWD